MIEAGKLELRNEIGELLRADGFDEKTIDFLLAELDRGGTLYWAPGVEGSPNPIPIYENGFRTEDGRFPYYIRDEQGARDEYGKLREKTGLVPLRPGRLLSEAEFLEVVSQGDKGIWLVQHQSELLDCLPQHVFSHRFDQKRFSRKKAALSS